MASSGLLVMAPAIIATFFWKRATTAGALVSMIIGGTLTVVLHVLDLRAGFKLAGQWPAVWRSAVTVVVFVGLSLVTRPPKTATEFVDGVASELTKVTDHGLAE